MFSMFRKVNARERVVGWYHTGPKLRSNDISINELVRRYSPHSVLVIVDVQPKEQMGLPTEAYISVEEVHDDGSPSSRTFDHIPSEIGAEEAEEVGVEHLLRDIRESTVGTLSQRITDQLLGLRGLRDQLAKIYTYLDQVRSSQLPINHEVIYVLQDIFNLLPDVTVPQLIRSLQLSTNDRMLAIYMASLLRAVGALHNLINNQLANRDTEKAEQSAAAQATSGKDATKKAGDKEGDKSKEPSNGAAADEASKDKEKNGGAKEKDAKNQKKSGHKK